MIACDFSPRAISLVQRHPLYAQSDIQAFSADITCPEELEQIPLNCVDVATLVFVLSAIHPKKWSQAMDNIYKRIKPGGWLLIRDYGRYDMAQIRFKSGHKIADNFYMRQVSIYLDIFYLVGLHIRLMIWFSNTSNLKFSL